MKGINIEKFINDGGLQPGIEGQADELFIVCASYEERSIATVNSLSEGYRSKKGMVYVNDEFLQEPIGTPTEKNVEYLKSALDRHCDEVVVIKGSWLSAKSQLEALKSVLLKRDKEPPKGAVITIDTTTFNREALLTAMLLLRTHYQNARIRTVYVSPQNHGEWLSRGFRCIRNVLGFSGIQEARQPNILIVLSGFEPERTLKIIEEHEPSKVLLGIADPPTDPSFLDRNRDDHKLILSRQDVEEFCFPAGDINECWNCLESLVKDVIEENNVIIAPMNTKPSTLAVLLTAEKHVKIQITYCLPGEYNLSEYSKGIKKIYIDEMPPVGNESRIR